MPARAPPARPALDADDLPHRFARAILRRNLELKPGENLTVEAWSHTLPYATAIVREARRLKAHPLLIYEDEPSYWDSVDHGEEKLLGAAPDHEWGALAKTDVYLHMWGPGDRVRLNALPPKKLGALFGWNEKWYQTAGKADLRGARLEIGRVYPELARAYGVDEESWQRQVLEGSMVDPAALARSAAPIVRALARGKRVHISHENGTDLTLALEGKRPAALLGRITPEDKKRNNFSRLMYLPAGSIRAPLSIDVAEGTIVGNRTCYYDDGVATFPHFQFANGRLVHSEFASGAERFDAPFKEATKGRDRPGFLVIGLNPKLHNTPQVEDVEAGCVLVSLGGSQQLGGRNKSNFFGWAITAGARLEIDGKAVPLPTPD